MTGSADATNTGDPGYGFYLIVSGAVNVRIRETDPVTGCVGGRTAPVVCVCVYIIGTCTSFTQSLDGAQMP